jgi:hypothetical protein
MAPVVYQAENEWYRDAARLLSDVRDAEALVETYDELLDASKGEVDRRAFAPIRRKLTLRRGRITEDQVGLEERLNEFRSRLRAGRSRVREWDLDAEGFDAIEGGLKKTYGRARKAVAKARDDDSAERLHEWRKRAKYHWYHMRLLRDVWCPVLQARRAEVKRVSGSLGDDRNLLMLRHTLLGNLDEFGRVHALEAFVGLLDRRRIELQATAHRVGACVFAEKPKRLARRFRAYWSAWREDDELLPTDLAEALAPTGR